MKLISYYHEIIDDISFIPYDTGNTCDRKCNKRRSGEQTGIYAGERPGRQLLSAGVR